MKISMWMLHDAMSSLVTGHNLSDAASSRHIAGALPYVENDSMSTDHVYIMPAHLISKEHLKDNVCLVVYGAGQTAALSDPLNQCQYIRLQPGLSAADCIKNVLMAFEHYNNWYAALQKELIGNPDLTRICEIGYKLLGNYITLFDPEHNLIAYANIPDKMIGSVLERKDGPYYVLTDQSIKSMVGSPGHTDDLRAEHADYFYDAARKMRILYANVGPGRFECRLCIGEQYRPFKNSDMQLCEILAETLLTAMQVDHSRGAAIKTQLRDTLRDIINGQFITDVEMELERNLELRKWARHDKFICIELVKRNPSSRLVSSDQYICSRMEEMLPDACSFMLDTKIVCIDRLLSNESADQTIERLRDFLTDSIFIVGVSDEFDNIMDISSYYKEASIAIEMGRLKNDSDWYYKFSDYAQMHFFQHGTSILPAVYYCDKSIQHLMQLDKSKVDYCQTLRVYLECDRNLLHAAERLHIHRTTLFYRLKRINDMIDADLDDTATRMRMLISFQLMTIDQSLNAPKNAG